MKDGDDSPALRLGPLSPAAPGALYEQIVEGIRREISLGSLAPHAPLPSFRQLARELRVSLITVKRAYEQLEAEGVIYRHQGLGTFVSDDAFKQVESGGRARARERLEEAAREARQAGVSEKEWQKWSKECWRQENRNEPKWRGLPPSK